MKFLMVHVGPIKKYPPALSIIQHLNDLGYDLILCTTDIDENTEKLCNERNIRVLNIDANYEKPVSPLFKLIRLVNLKNKLWGKIDKIYDEDTVIWVFSDLALKHLGKRLLGKRYVLHMFELAEKSVYYRKFPKIALHTEKYAKRALGVIQAEYNRAHISKTWWNLDKLPYVLPNKPYDDEAIKKNSEITDNFASNVINMIKDKKIILYQGIISKERPLEPFIKAINKLGNDYAFVVMTSGENIYEDIKSENFYFIPFVAPPYHLEITSNAYIGVLTYVPTKNEFSKLNALYCAPNKLYEYSLFGIPMIGNDIPGLKYVFDTKKCGTCFESFDEVSIINSIKAIEEDYNNMSKASKNFYNKTDIKKILGDIINDIELKLKKKY